MKNIKMNETPRRTAKSFYINDINIDFLDISEIQPFNNVEIKSNNNLVKIDEKFDLPFFTYGMLKKQDDKIKVKNNKQIKIQIPENNEIIEPIHICFSIDDNQSKLVEEIIIEAKQNSKSHIYLQYKGKGKMNDAVHYGSCYIKVKSNAELTLTVFNQLGEKLENFYEIEIQQDDESIVKTNLIELGGGTNLSNYFARLGTKSIHKLNSIYFGAKEQILDLNYILQIDGMKANAIMDVQGALKGNAKKNFKGTIDFKKGCRGAKGKEHENCILLSPKVISRSLPMLLCTEEDVEGEHSTASGKIEESLLFYLMARGITYEEAKRMMVRANLRNKIQEIHEEFIKKEILHELENIM